MANEPTGAQQNPVAQNSMPRFAALGQYIRDLSVENPNAPASLQPQQSQPQIDININVLANRGNDTDYEVQLKLETRARSDDTILFVIDLTYAGVFRIENIPQDQIQLFIMVEAPRFLFPFAREIIANATRQAGFPPLMIDPVDFLSLYRQRMAQAQQEAQGQA
jgi:preprotein translocase subunit SecB